MALRTRLGILLAVATTLSPLTPSAMAAADRSTEVVPVVSALRTNSLTDPLAVPAGTPRLSWQLDAPRRGVTQRRYEVHVASTAGLLGTPDVWNSGVVESDRSVDVPYGGPALTPYTAYFWNVRVWDETGTASAWSPVARFETGALQPSDWRGDWIGADDPPDPAWADYTMDLDVTVTADALGVFFRGRGRAGYLWQLNRTEGRNRLRPHVRRADHSYEVLGEIPLAVDLARRQNLRISVVGQTITTFVNGVQVDRRDRADHNGPGTMGFRISGPETALVHRLKVTNTAGQVLVDTGFPAGDGTFPEGFVRPEGGLRIDGGQVLGGQDVEWWLPGRRLPLFRKDISLPTGKTVVRARIHAAAQGVYQLRLNGTKVGDHELAPGWTDYSRRIQSQSYDVTPLVKGGANTLGAELSNGWFAGNLAHVGGNKYGSVTALSAQLRVSYDDGTTDVFDTDSSWRTAPGAVRVADLMNGEAQDGRFTKEGWDRPGYDATGWAAVHLRPSATAKLVPQTDQPVRVTQQLPARAIASPTPGAYLYDLGQNMVGVGRFTLTGSPGQGVKIRYGEVLDRNGNLYTDNLRTAEATDHYTFATSSPEVFQPRHTFHGFRYIEITGPATAPPASAVTGVVFGTDAPRTSSLTTSSALVNQLHSNILWGQRGNFLSIPTDTPARDERLGWTGDINVFGRTAVYNLDSQAFLTKWLRDLRDAQAANGSYPSVAPIVPGSRPIHGEYGMAGWADAGVNVPWTLWQAYGDTTVVREHYSSMTRYVDFLVSTSSGFIRNGGMYKDWLNLNDPTPEDLIGTAFVAKSARQLSQLATAVGNTADAAKYQKVYDDVKAAFAARFVAGDGKVGSDSQTGYILALTSDLVPADRIAAAGQHFVNAILRRGTHLSTGFLGVDGLLPVLTKIGRDDLAYELLQKSDFPSWGYEIGKGATTIWEHWDSIKVNGDFNDPSMNSFNHYAYGAVGEWMYRTLAGVSAAEPGYRKSLIAPTLGAGLSFSDFKHGTRYGEVASRWERVGTDGLKLDVTVPGNTTATVRIPAGAPAVVTESGQPLSSADHVSNVVDTGETVTVTVASGKYRFVVEPVPVELRSSKAEPGSGEPGSRTTVSAVVRNTSAAPVTGRLSVAVPAGWTTPAPSAPVTIAAGAEASLSVPVEVSLVGNAAPVTLTARFSDSRGELVSASVPFTVTQSLSPGNAIDYVDLGAGGSETAHAVTAAPSSGTGTEAGRTRRYSGRQVPGSWFEFNLGIRAGQPFLMRLVETYDQHQVKDYEVRVNGTVVHRRWISRSSGGLETYQILVDNPALLSGPTVRVRIQHNATASGYDPSLADVWSLPLP